MPVKTSKLKALFVKIYTLDEIKNTVSYFLDLLVFKNDNGVRTVFWREAVRSQD